MKTWIAAALGATFMASLAFAQDAKPENADERLRDLERRIKEQQGEIDALTPGKAPAPVDEKGAVPAAKERAPSDSQFAWGFEDGFFVRTKIQDVPFELRPRARIQLDYRAFMDS